MTRPKIKDKLPEKLPPVEPDVKEKTEGGGPVTEEKLGPEITEDFIKEEVIDEKKESEDVETKEEEAAKQTDTVPLETKGEEGREEGPDTMIGGFIRPELKEGETVIIHDPAGLLKDPTAKPAQPDRYPSHAGKKEEQPFLFGEADQILNALETELSYWNGVFDKLDETLDRTRLKMDTVKLRIASLHSAVAATRKHAPMKEDPSPKVFLAPEPDKVVSTITHITEIPDPLPESKITSSSTDPAPEAPTSSGKAYAPLLEEENKKINGPKEEVAPGEAERNKAAEDLIVKFRNPTQPLPELLFPGDIIVTSWETGPYRVEKITGPYNEVDDLQRGGMLPSPNHYSIQCSDVDAKRNKDGRLAKNYAYSYLNMVIAVGNRFLSVYADSNDEVTLTAEAVDKKKEISGQKPEPDQRPLKPEPKDPAEEEIY